MLIQAPAPPQTFLQQIMPYIVSFLALVIPAFGAWIVTLLKANHTATVAGTTAATLAANEASDRAAVASEKLDTVVTQTNGINANLQNHVDVQKQLIDSLKANQK
jgi:hypothetical protein